MSNVAITLNGTNRRQAAKALGFAPNSPEWKAFSGPVFNDVGCTIEPEGVYVNDKETGATYFYPMSTISRVKVF